MTGMKRKVRSLKAERMRKNGITILCAALLFSGCATQRHFVEDQTGEPPKMQEDAVIVAVAPMIKTREGNGSTDAVYAGKPNDDIPTVIQQKLMSTGLFEDVLVFRKIYG